MDRFGSSLTVHELSMVSRPVVSFIMPTHNREIYIDDAIRSVVSQTFQNWELIIVDDHSGSDTVARIKDWLRKDSRIKAVFNSRNEGIAKSRNNGMRVASGKYVSFIDSDDMLRKDALERMANELEQDSDYGVVVAESALIDEKGQLIGKTSADRFGKPKLQTGIFFDELIDHTFVTGNMFRREVVEKYGIRHDENLKLADDWGFWLDLSAVCKFKYLDEPLHYYRIHHLSLSQTPAAIGREMYAQDFMLIPERIFSKHAKLLNSRQMKGLLKFAARFLEPSSLEAPRTRAAFYRSIVADIEKLESENIILQSELKTIKSGFMYRYVKSLSSKLDHLSPDNTLRGKFRKWVTLHLR